MHDHTLQHARQAEPWLAAIAGLSDPQVGLLLRACAGYARVLHSMRCTPSHAHVDALAHFDQLVQSSLASLTGLPLTPASPASVTCDLKLGARQLSPQYSAITTMG